MKMKLVYDQEGKPFNDIVCRLYEDTPDKIGY